MDDQHPGAPVAKCRKERAMFHHAMTIHLRNDPQAHRLAAGKRPLLGRLDAGQGGRSELAGALLPAHRSHLQIPGHRVSVPLGGITPNHIAGRVAQAHRPPIGIRFQVRHQLSKRLQVHTKKGRDSAGAPGGLATAQETRPTEPRRLAQFRWLSDPKLQFAGAYEPLNEFSGQ